MYTIILLIISITSVQCRNTLTRKRGYNYQPPNQQLPPGPLPPSQLPEIISNDPLDDSGYQYPIPSPPLFDETTPSNSFIPSNLYGPPNLDLPRPNLTLPPIQGDIPIDYPSYVPPPPLEYPQPPLEPPSFDEDVPNKGYLPPSGLYDSPSAQFRVSNMSCLNSPSGGYFRATMSLTRSAASLPVVDDAPADCITGSGDVFRLDFEGERMRRCGVRFCSNGINMCVVMRIPTVRGLKLPEDTQATFRCRPQERVVARTRQLRLNTQNSLNQGRTFPGATNTVITGGSQQNFETQVSLFRRAAGGVGNGNGPGEFTRLVSPGSSVFLGEELLLRAAVRDGDGWRYSRLGDVIVHHVAAGGRGVRQRAVTLLDAAGCRDPRTRAVVPSDPVQSTPLVSTLTVRAFMFQGMTSGDEMLMSVKMIACLHYEDCHGKTRSCEDKPLRSARLRRFANNSTSDTTSDFQSYLEFRVVSPGVEPRTEDADDASATSAAGIVGASHPKLRTMALYLLAGMVSCFFVVAAIAGLVAYRGRMK